MRYLVGLAALILAACDSTGPQPTKEATAKVPQCGMDADCKGDRVCDSGKCIFPPQAALAPKSKHQTTTPFSRGISVCEAADRRTRIAVWTPEVDAEGNLSSEPPSKDGQIVFIELWTDAKNVTCNEKELNSFSRPTNPKSPTDGGLAVNLRGNTQFANGTCYFRGYYMNEDVMGMHQGWIETYFGAVDKEKIALSDEFCLARPLP